MILLLTNSDTPTLLVIEDDPQAVYLIRRYVAQRGGYQVMEASQAEKALSIAREAGPAVILLDIHLRGTNGWSLLRQLKADPLTRHIPVFMYSALEEQERARAEGANGYLQKPVLYQDFIAALAQADLGGLKRDALRLSGQASQRRTF